MERINYIIDRDKEGNEVFCGYLVNYRGCIAQAYSLDELKDKLKKMFVLMTKYSSEAIFHDKIELVEMTEKKWFEG